MKNLLLLVVAAGAMAPGCGSKKSEGGKALQGDPQFVRLDSRIGVARKALTPYAMPDFDDMEKTATQYAGSVKGGPNEANANKLVEKIREVRKRADDKKPYEEIKKGFGEIDAILATLRPN